MLGEDRFRLEMWENDSTLGNQETSVLPVFKDLVELSQTWMSPVFISEMFQAHFPAQERPDGSRERTRSRGCSCADFLMVYERDQVLMRSLCWSKLRHNDNGVGTNYYTPLSLSLPPSLSCLPAGDDTSLSPSPPDHLEISTHHQDWDQECPLSAGMSSSAPATAPVLHVGDVDLFCIAVLQCWCLMRGEESATAEWLQTCDTLSSAQLSPAQPLLPVNRPATSRRARVGVETETGNQPGEIWQILISSFYGFIR